MKNAQRYGTVILVSSTTRSFIDIELRELVEYFETNGRTCKDNIFSTLDDLGYNGKPSEMYRQLAGRLGKPDETCWHIGDDNDADVKNAKEAGWQSSWWDGKHDTGPEPLGFNPPGD